jgi:hypothetical protein
MDSKWFEMADVRRRSYNAAAWLPLRAVNTIERIGSYGDAGHREEFFGAGTVAIPSKYKELALKLGWGDVGIMHNHAGCFQNGCYYLVHEFRQFGSELRGEHLVLDQHGNQIEHSEWHLNQDLVLTLGLKRENDIWVRPDEGYLQIAELQRNDDDGRPKSLHFRASHLKDYLCAREMGLCITYYHQRLEVLEDATHITWESSTTTSDDGWEGRKYEIHEGGMPFGGKTAIVQVTREDVDFEEDVPQIGPLDKNLRHLSWTKEDQGRKLFVINGELWRTEWIEPAKASLIVRGDKIEPTIFFIVNTEGKKESGATLRDSGRWLWFQPHVINTLLSYRRASLSWHTRDTGQVACSPDYSVNFGVNSLGLVTAYAKDVVWLPEWQQKIWSGFNVGPDGKVSSELLAAQAGGEPCSSLAPEAYIKDGFDYLQKVAVEALGIAILRKHDEFDSIIGNCHRFRALNKNGLFELAKDLSRLTADSLQVEELRKIVQPPKTENWGSLKSLEKMLALKWGDERARGALSPLFGVYELRLADAHLPTEQLDESLKKVGVDAGAPNVHQGLQLLHSFVTAIHSIGVAIERGWR